MAMLLDFEADPGQTRPLFLPSSSCTAAACGLWSCPVSAEAAWALDFAGLCDFIQASGLLEELMSFFLPCALCLSLFNGVLVALRPARASAV